MSNTVKNSRSAGAAELSGVLLHALQEGARTLQQIEEVLCQCTSGLRAGGPSEIAPRIKEVIGNLLVLSEFIEQMRKALWALHYEEAAFGRWCSSLDLFEQLVTSLENRDWVAFSDLVDYELLQRLRETRSEMQGWMERLSK